MDEFEQHYRAVQSKDSRFDGWFFTAVTSTHIYCRPSCPAITPKRSNVRFYPTSAAAQMAGFRACMRCRPDAAPGSPEWDSRADVVARAMKLIRDGVVDRHGVTGLASRLGYGERQLHRHLVAEVGTGALAIARAQRAQTARILLETTDLPVAQIAFAAGFSSIRQCNDTIREVFAMSPTGVRKKHRSHGVSSGGAITLRLAHREPFDSQALFEYLAVRGVSGVEAWADGTYSRSIGLPHGDGVVELTPGDGGGYVQATFHLQDLRDLTTAVSRCRRLLDLDADPVAVAEVLVNDPLLRPLVRRSPGRRVAGTVDGTELAVRAVIGQQVSVAGARQVAGRLAVAIGRPLAEPYGQVTHLFPSAADLLDAEDEAFAMPSSRRRAIRTLVGAVADGDLVIDPGTDPADLEQRLRALPGIGPWTASYVLMRALRDPDMFLPTDVGIRRALVHLGVADDQATIVHRSERWRPWRAYAMAHLWALPTGRRVDQPPNTTASRRSPLPPRNPATKKEEVHT